MSNANEIALINSSLQDDFDASIMLIESGTALQRRKQAIEEEICWTQYDKNQAVSLQAVRSLGESIRQLLRKWEDTVWRIERPTRFTVKKYKEEWIFAAGLAVARFAIAKTLKKLSAGETAGTSFILDIADRWLGSGEAEQEAKAIVDALKKKHGIHCAGYINDIRTSAQNILRMQMAYADSP